MSKWKLLILKKILHESSYTLASILMLLQKVPFLLQGNPDPTFTLRRHNFIDGTILSGFQVCLSWITKVALLTKATFESYQYVAWNQPPLFLNNPIGKTALRAIN